jgi:TonB family protein
LWFLIPQSFSLETLAARVKKILMKMIATLILLVSFKAIYVIEINMKQIHTSFFLLFIASYNLFSQTGTIKVVKPKQDTIISQNNFEVRSILTIVEQMPTFPGGETEMFKFIQKNVKYPATEKDANISGICYVNFVVEEDGRLTDIKILRGVPKCLNCDKEAVRVVSLMPKWIPGKQNGKTVRVDYNLRISFSSKK